MNKNEVANTCLLIGFIIGILLAMFATDFIGYTYRINTSDVTRAELKCKDGKWDWINDDVIMCKDEGTYKRRIMD